MRLNLPGAHQIENAMSVLRWSRNCAVRGGRFPIRRCTRGLASTVWPARLEWCGRILIDGAHNPQGVRALRNFVEEQLPNQRRVLLTGVLADKLQEDMLRDFCAIADEIVTVTPDNPRALDAQTYADALCQRGAHAQAGKIAGRRSGGSKAARRGRRGDCRGGVAVFCGQPADGAGAGLAVK